MYSGDTAGTSPAVLIPNPSCTLCLWAPHLRSEDLWLFQVQLPEAEECRHPDPEALAGPQLQEELRAGEPPQGLLWAPWAFEPAGLQDVPVPGPVASCHCPRCPCHFSSPESRAGPGAFSHPISDV